MVHRVSVMLVLVSDDGSLVNNSLYIQAFSVKRHTKFRLKAKPHAIVFVYGYFFSKLLHVYNLSAELIMMSVWCR